MRGLRNLETLRTPSRQVSGHSVTLGRGSLRRAPYKKTHSTLSTPAEGRDGPTNGPTNPIRGSTGVDVWRRQEWSLKTADNAKPTNLRLGLPDVHARDGARNDQALNFRGPFEDRVVPIGATRSTGRDTFRREMDPQINGKTSFRPDLVRSRSPLMALARAPLRVAVCITSE